MTETKAVIAPPKRKQSFGLEKLVTAPTEAADNMSAAEEVNMTFRVEKSFHRKFKAVAGAKGLSMKDILIEAMDAWYEKNV